MNNKKTLIISFLAMLTILILVLAIIFFSLNNQEEKLQENMQIIRSNYASFSTNVITNENIRTELIDKTEQFDKLSYEDEVEAFKEILTKYDKNMKYIDSLIEDMESRCKHKYDDLNTTILCQGYAGLYETTVNKYILNVRKYNDKVTKYNTKNNKDHKTHKLIYDDFIDYDKNGKYSGSK